MPSEPEDRQRARGGWLALPSCTWNADRLGSVAQCWSGRPRPDDLFDTTPESANPAGLFPRQPAISRGAPAADSRLRCKVWELAAGQGDPEPGPALLV